VSHSASSGCPELDLPEVILADYEGTFFHRKSSCHSSNYIDKLLLDFVPPAEIIYPLKERY
jgi:hypothetical protein